MSDGAIGKVGSQDGKKKKRTRKKKSAKTHSVSKDHSILCMFQSASIAFKGVKNPENMGVIVIFTRSFFRKDLKALSEGEQFNFHFLNQSQQHKAKSSNFFVFRFFFFYL